MKSTLEWAPGFKTKKAEGHRRLRIAMTALDDERVTSR